MSYAIVESPHGLRFYGGMREFWRYKGHEAMLEGPYETGKTLGALTKLHTLLCKYPKCRALMARKTYKSLINSAIVTYEHKVLPYPPGNPRCAIHKFGGEKPEFYDYPNGSRLVVGGLDNTDRILSAEYDYIYVNQAEELRLKEWEDLVGRATGRAEHAPYPQVFGDCNPGPPTHWILSRPTLKRFRQLHEHNPTLFDQTTGLITERGKVSIGVLDSLTGIRYKRGRKGLWVAAEGQVYDNFDPDIHVIDPFEIPASWRRYRAIDFGFTNPFSCGWWAADEDGRLFLYQEIYMTGRTVRVHSQDIKLYSGEDHFTMTVADHDAEDRATLKENGIHTTAAIKDITRGIQAVQERLKKQKDGKARLYIFRDALLEADKTLYRERPGDLYPCCTEHEFASYVWAQGMEGKLNKEVPIDLYNHGMDMVRYMVMALDGKKEPPLPRIVTAGR